MAAKYEGGGEFWTACAKCGVRVKMSPNRQVGAKFYHVDHLPAKGKVVGESMKVDTYAQVKWGDTKAAVKKASDSRERARKAAVKARQSERKVAREAKKKAQSA